MISPISLCLYLFCRRDDNLIEVPLDIMPKFDFTDITEMDVEKAFSFTSELIALEIMNRIMITIFEVRKKERKY